jgi:hypothetical protein
MGRWERLDKRYRRQAARITAKEPASVSFKVQGQFLRWSHQSPWSDSPLYHDPNDPRVELAIRAFHDRGYRLVREEPSSMEGSVGGVSFKERAVTLVFAPADAMPDELPTEKLTQTPKLIRLLPFVGLVGLVVFFVCLVLWLVLVITGRDEGAFYNSVIAVGVAMFVCVSALRFIYESRTGDS